MACGSSSIWAGEAGAEVSVLTQGAEPAYAPGNGGVGNLQLVFACVYRDTSRYYEIQGRCCSPLHSLHLVSCF